MSRNILRMRLPSIELLDCQFGRERRRTKERNTMATENDSDEVVLTYDDSYYEERASVEEIYLELIIEELRSQLISETPDTAFES